MKRSNENPTFNNIILESVYIFVIKVIAIRNAIIFWTYLVLLISQVFTM